MEFRKRVLIPLIIVLLITGFSGVTYAEKNNKNKPGQSQITYSVYNSFEELLTATNARYVEPLRISPVGTKRKPMYHGFFFYNCMILFSNDFIY